MFSHLMTDLETMGTRFDAPVIAIGACFFDPNTGAIGEKFYRAIDMSDACRHGRLSGDTVKWWLQQSDDARAAVTAGSQPAAEAFKEFAEFYGKYPNVAVWGNGATFDISILEYAFLKILGQAAPWAFWLVRDCRTIKDIASGIAFVPKVARQGTHHQALDDAVFQAQWVSEMWQVLRGKKEPEPRKQLVPDDILASEPTPAAADDDLFG
jgi:hypothetical protein